jgi:uncharacterized protein (DUF1800 family)
MVINNQLKNQHLRWRAGFGPKAEEFQQLASASQKSYLKALFAASAKTPAFIEVADEKFRIHMISVYEMKQMDKTVDEQQKRQLRQQHRDGIKTLNLTWLNQMATSEQQLREKMSLFWHGHFATRTVNVLFQQQLLDVIRRHALGNFGELLREVSKSASMINFLNNNQNKKGHPNENFAREVMELFTLGRGNYTEQDIKESARAFTGWGANPSGEFIFRKNQHDKDQKTILGKTGSFDGDDVLNILLEQKQTAHYITRKIYKYFVNETVDENQVEKLAGRFYQSNYDISALMHDIFSSEWFYEAKNIGCHIKSPVELLTGIRRALPMQIENQDIQLTLQRLLGQLLFYPPNVAGWPGGKSWIDSSSLMLRMRIPQMIYMKDELTMKPKDDDDQMMGMKDKAIPKKYGNKGGQLITANVDWQAFMKKFDKTPREKLLTEISNVLLQVRGGINETMLAKYTDASSKESFIKSAAIQLMSTPEYQLC